MIHIWQAPEDGETPKFLPVLLAVSLLAGAVFGLWLVGLGGWLGRVIAEVSR